MSLLVDAFAAGIRLATSAFTLKIQQLEQDKARLEGHLDHALTIIRQTQRITLIMQITDDNAARIKVQEKDRLGAAITGETLTATVDQPGKATVAQDPDNPTQFVVTRLPLAEGDPDVLTVVVTITDTATGMTGTQSIEFDPGKAATMEFNTEIEALPSTAAATTPPAVGDTVSIPANPSDSTSPPVDHTVTDVSADGSTITAEPVDGGDAVTVPASSVTPEAS